jgi:hypothetical protein
MGHHHEALIKHEAELHHESLIHKEKMQHELKAHFSLNHFSLNHSSLIDGYTYKELNNLFGHRSSEFYHEQAVIAERYRKENDNQLPQTLFWDYLEARRAIDPVRFDHYHPIVGQWIADIPPPFSIAEPGSGVLLGIGLIIILIFKRL